MKGTAMFEKTIVQEHEIEAVITDGVRVVITGEEGRVCIRLFGTKNKVLTCSQTTVLGEDPKKEAEYYGGLNIHYKV